MTTQADGVFHVGEIGKKILATFFDLDASGAKVIVDVSGATTREIRYRKPDDTEGKWTAVFETDGSDGKIAFTTTDANDLDQQGKWKIEGYVAGSGFAWHTERATLQVDSPLPGA